MELDVRSLPSLARMLHLTVSSELPPEHSNLLIGRTFYRGPMLSLQSGAGGQVFFWLLRLF
jgi:hypothetical protein